MQKYQVIYVSDVTKRIEIKRLSDGVIFRWCLSDKPVFKVGEILELP
jgi:HrpA-like RNA helicase